MDKDTLLAQYKECYEHLRQHERFMWQIPSLLTLINGGLVVVVFTFMSGSGVVPKLFVLAIALALTLTMAYVQRKHRYFSKVLTGTLSSLEIALEVKHIQKVLFAFGCTIVLSLL